MLNDRLIEARKMKGVSAQELASKVGISASTLYNWEAGLAVPRSMKSREALKAIAAECGVTEKWLTSGIEPKTEAERIAIKKDFEERKPTTSVVYRAKDKRQLEDIELVISHLRDLCLTTDEKKAVFLTLSEIRSDLEMKVLFGSTTSTT